MAKLKVPSLQHLARIWRSDPDAIKRVLVRLSTNGPTFSYDPLHKIVKGMLLFGTPYDQAVESVNRIPREDVKSNFAELMPLIHGHFSNVSPTFVGAVAPRLYSIGRDLQIPFAPSLIFGANGIVHFPWMSFWKSNPLQGEALSLFVTIVEEVLLQDSDLEEAKFEILDFSASAPKKPRELNVVDTSRVQRLTEPRKTEMLAIFAEGFRMAKAELHSNVESLGQAEVAEADQDQMPLF